MRVTFICVLIAVIIAGAFGCKSPKTKDSAKKAPTPAIQAPAPEAQAPAPALQAPAPVIQQPGEPAKPAPEPEDLAGRKTKERFKMILKDRAPLFRRCYEQRNLKASPGHPAKAMLTVSITAEGKLDRAQVELKDHIRDARFSRCVEKELEVMELPPPGRAVVLRYPMSFGE